LEDFIGPTSGIKYPTEGLFVIPRELDENIKVVQEFHFLNKFLIKTTILQPQVAKLQDL
jgi:hypothetical protein